jgi:ParB-like nuclease domain.
MNKITRIKSIRDLKKLDFRQGYAIVEIDIEDLHHFQVINGARAESPRLQRVCEAIRDEGYNNLDPIMARLTPSGKIYVEDGGHRLTAAYQVNREFLTNLFGNKVDVITFLLRDGHYFRKVAKKRRKKSRMLIGS